MRATLVALTVVLVAGSGAERAAAHAVMSVDATTITYNGNDEISNNQLTVSLSGDRIRFRDPGSDGGIMVGNDCDPGEISDEGFIVEVFCPVRPNLRIDVADGQDSVTVTAASNTSVIGGGGRDTIVTGPGADAVNGGDGDDDINAGAGNDIIRGEAGNDTLRGGDGNDTVQAGIGFDEVFGDAGDDVLQVRDGVADRTVSCGAGNDQVTADVDDPVTDGIACEKVETGQAAPSETAPPGTGTTPGAGPGTTVNDRRAPRVRSGGSTLQRISRSNTLTVLATSDEAATVLAAGTIRFGDRRIILKSARRQVNVAGGGVALRLKVPKSALRSIRAALKKRVRVIAVITVAASDEAGNSSSSKLPSIRLRR